MSSPRSPRLVLRSPYGGLGNSLYRFANLVALAIEHDLEVRNDAFVIDEFARWFEGPCRGWECRFPAPTALATPSGAIRRVKASLGSSADWLVRPEKLCNFSSTPISIEETAFLDRLRRTEKLVLEGYGFQADRAVSRCRAQLVEYFRPVESLRLAAQKLHDRQRSGSELLVAVHLRLGDFKTWHAGKFFFEPERYRDFMEKVRHLFAGRKARFVLFSDERLNPDLFSGFDFTISDGNLFEDLVSMSQCDYLLSPACSSFSGWASFFGNVPICRIRGPKQEICLESFVPITVLNNFTEL